MKRTETYMSRGKCLAESSPGEEYTDASWTPRSPHEAPPARGILSLYNSGTRARWYWPCQHCGEFFEAAPGMRCFALPAWDELAELVQQSDLMSLAERFAKVVCPHCGGAHEPEHRPEMNARGRWLHEGEQIVGGEIVGERRRTSIVSYWLGGVAAAYQTWPSIVHKYLMAVLTFVRTGDEQPLKATTNTDQGAAYIPMAAANRRSTEALQNRVESWERGIVPEGVRFLTAAVDVQARRFVVTVMGWGVGLESWLIERFSITTSAREEGSRLAAIDPASYAEDWDVLVEQVIEQKYRAGDVELPPLLVFCDSGGSEGVTARAYEFWRRMRVRGFGQRFMLVKGVGNLNAPRVQQTWPDARARKDRSAGRGDVPVWLLNVNVIKDGVSGDLAREVPGPGYVHIPDWIDDAYFAEIGSERRTAKGWERQGHARNEAFDLHAYNRAACIVLKAEAIDWSRPPEWAMSPGTRADLTRARAERRAKAPDMPPRRNWVKNW